MSNQVKFIISTSVKFFGASNAASAADQRTVVEFLEDDELSAIAAVHDEANDHIRFDCRTIPTDERCLLFYKVTQPATTGKQQQQQQQPLGILTLESNHKKSPDLNTLLENLRTHRKPTAAAVAGNAASLEDEIHLWQQKLQRKSSSRVEREMAQLFSEVLQNIDRQMSSIDGASSTSVDDFLDASHNSLDELWRLPYNFPQSNMANILDIIGNRLLNVCIEQLEAGDIRRRLTSQRLSNLLSRCSDTVDSWLQLSDSLTRLFWPNYAQHRWLGEPHSQQRLQLFKQRLADIRAINSLCQEMSLLLDEQEASSWLSSFTTDVDIFDTTAAGQRKWASSLQQFERLLQPVDERLAAALKSQLRNHLKNARQAICVFAKYETLAKRPAVLELLTVEREQLLQAIQVLLRELRQALADPNAEADVGHLSAACHECRWLKVVQHQVEQVHKVSHLISSCSGYDAISKEVQHIKDETESLLRSNFEMWCGQRSEAVRSGELKLHDDQPVVRFDAEGRQLMRVTFNPQLISFSHDVREFESLGYSVPGELRAAASHAANFLSHARRLQQIATFHNTIGDRMIPCQRPIMLQSALQLSKLVQSETVAWSDAAAVQRYVDSLQSAIARLAADNALLAGYHEQAKKTVIKLMNIDLVSQGQLWKEEMRNLRSVVTALERQNFTKLDAFRLHWDYQLYKVLEFQYLHGLLDMNSKLPDIHVDVLFRQRRLRFHPPEEELREKYFTQLRRFVESPASFRGLSAHSVELFRSIVENNRDYFDPLYQKAEELFAKLRTFRDLWTPWVALGCVDVEELCAVHLNSGSDWDRNFKACKNFGQKVAKLQTSEESIDCFVINILPLRSDIEFISRRYWDALANSLRNSILNDIAALQEFLQSSAKFLNNVALDEDSIAESGRKYEQLTTDLPKISQILCSVREKDACLAGWCKERVSALDDVTMRWEQLQPAIANHSAILERQVSLVKDQLRSEIENLRSETENFVLRWESMIDALELNDDATLELFKERQANWSHLQSRQLALAEECAKYNTPFPEDASQSFADVDSRIQAQSEQWRLYDKYLSELAAISAEEWSIYRRRPHALTDFIASWQRQVQSSIDVSAKRIRRNIDDLQALLPVLQQLQSDALSERHWTQIFMLLRKGEGKRLHETTLGDILEDRTALQKAAAEITNIVKAAAAEQIVRQALTELDQWSVTASFKFATHTDSAHNTLALIKDYQDVMNKVADQQSLLRSASSSAASDSFSDQTELWERRLNALDRILDSLSQAQRRWIYLEPIFGAGALKGEEATFRRIDKDFRHVMREAEADPRVVSLLKVSNISTIIDSIELQLLRCQKSLVSYLAEKRNLFPRFYFLSDDDLLEVLGQAAKDVEVLMKHIRKLFPGCHRVDISTLNQIVAVQSAEGDSLPLKQPVEMKGAVEVWLNNLVNSIQHTLQEQIIECCQSKLPSSNEANLRKYPIQVLTTARSILFTAEVEKAIVAMCLPRLLASLNDEIAQCTALKGQTTDSQLLQLKLRSLLFDLLHFVAVVKLLIANSAMHVGDWHWLQQFKFYLDGRQVVLRVVYAELRYSYEFVGNSNKLVSTGLTQKCYLVLSQAVHMGLGGNLFGPAGTGKTECVKALAAMLGRLVLVFNCDENLDSQSMGLILAGLVRCGAWGCFDEFNRLQPATLSVVSTLIQPIQAALRDKLETVSLGDQSIALNHHCAIFVTLNPADAEYGGRQQLPGSVQALFRPVAMQEPQPHEIARAMLFVDGFRSAEEIADRMVELFELSAKMLSKQRHYDWGLRELKAVLLGCGRRLAQQHLLSNSSPAADGVATELALVVRCLRHSIASKLQLADVARFEMLLRAIFPEVGAVLQQKSAVEEALAAAFPRLGYCANAAQIAKALQLHEQLSKRTGVIVVGPPGCGKSAIVALLQQALVALSPAAGSTVRRHTLSPKAMQREQLLGRLDRDTRQWMDGVLTKTAAAVSAEPPQVHSWIVCDGCIDPEWIEALNSVLDDNKTLTLPSGWRIQFGNNVNFIFETDDLRHASPATISRMGIINMSYEDFPLEPIMNSALSGAASGESYTQQLLLKVVEWMETRTSDRIVARNRLLSSFLRLKPRAQSREELCVLLFKMFSGFVATEQHNDLANFIMKRGDVYIAASPASAELSYFDSAQGTIEVFTSEETNTSSAADEVLVQTAHIKSYLAILETFLEPTNSSPFLIVGPGGAAKSSLLKHAVSQSSGYDLVIVNCSNQLTPAYIAHCLKKSYLTVSTTRGRQYNPKQQKVILYLKNLDLCHVDGWGASQVVEFLLQLVQRAGFYAENLEWIKVAGLQICASIASEERLRKVAPRFLALNHCLRVAYPKYADLLTILKIRLEPVVARFAKAPNLENVAEAMMLFFTKIQETFTPTIKANGHYHFSPKLLLKLVRNLTDYPNDVFSEALICELCCTFKDRLQSSEDADKFEVILKQTMRKFYRKEIVYFIPKNPSHASVLESCAPEAWMERVESEIVVCNNEFVVIDEPIIEELLYYIAKIRRVLMRSESNLLVLGEAGDRHLDAVYVAATMQEAAIYTPKTPKNYSLCDFYNDLKLATQTAALENKCTCFVIEQKWITFLPEIMKPIEAILEGSEILDLFGDDLEAVASSLKQAAALEGWQETISSFFFQRTRRNLHLILLLDSKSQKVNEYFRTYPSLYRNMDFLCTRPMSNRTKDSLPTKLIEMLDGNRNRNANERVPVPKIPTMSTLEQILTLKAPQRFYQFVKTYFVTYQRSSQQIMHRLKKLQLGVEKLAATHSVVDSLKTQAKQQEEALAEKRKLASEALEMITATMRNANQQKSTMLELKNKTQTSSEKLKERQRIIQKELSEVEPLLSEASAAVGKIKSEALSEVRSLRAPPEAVRDILEGVLRLMGIRDTSWNSMKTFLAKRGVKEEILSLDLSRISAENCEAVEKLLKAKSDSFEMRNAKRASAAAAPLAAWVKASVRYSQVIQSIKPLEREQNMLQQNLDTAEGELQSLMSGLDDVDNRVQQLSTKLNAYTQEAAMLELKLEEASSTLNAAELLVEQLSSEFEAWSTQLQENTQNHKTLDTKSLIISLVINYFSDMLLDKRNAIIDRVRSNTRAAVVSFELRSSLLTEQEQIVWESMGLACDAQVIENAALIREMLQLPFGSYPIPLMLDPTETGVIWLAEYLKSKGRSCEVTSQNNDRFTYSLELAVRFGKVLLINDCQELRPPLLQLIGAKVFVKFSKKQLEIGNKFVDLHEEFQLVLITKANRLSIGSETLTHLTCIPFTTTTAGLADQLLAKAIQLKNPQLEQKRIQLLKQTGELLRQRNELEDKLLEELATAQGDILKNEQLLNTLNEVKESSSFIDKSLQESAVIKQTFTAECTQLKAFCSKAAQFYTELSCCYDISVAIYIRLCLHSLENCEVADSNSVRLIYSDLVRSSFQYLARSTTRDSHLTLALFVCKSAYPDHIKLPEWQLFLTDFMPSAGQNHSTTASHTNFPDFIDIQQAAKLQALFAAAPQLKEQLRLQSDVKWRNFKASKLQEFPGEIRDSFHRVLVAQILRPDLAAAQLRKTAAAMLGISPDSVVQPTVEQLAGEVAADRAILVITKPENDPAADIKSVAINRNGTDGYVECSIGKGMEVKVLQSVQRAAATGQWICIKNVHLVHSTWLIELNRQLEIMDKKQDFRLWLLCESTQGFSDAVMSNFVIVFYEYPRGIKSKLRRMTQNFLTTKAAAALTLKDPKLVKLHVVLFITNAVLQERRKFIPEGWSKYYDFGDADLKAAEEILRWLYAKTASGKYDWKIMWNLYENVAYGGRISNSKDLKVLQLYMKEFFNDQVLNNRWTPLNLKVMVPTTSQLQDYFAAFDKFPDEDDPTVFKLSKYSNRNREIDLLKTIIKELKSLNNKNEKLELLDREYPKSGNRNFNKQLEAIIELWHKMTENSTLLQTAAEINESPSNTNPWETFIILEFKVGISCFREVQSTLSQIETLVDDSSRTARNRIDKNIWKSLTENQVPQKWLNHWNGPQSVMDYIRGLVTRANAAEKRYHEERTLEHTAQIDFATLFNCNTFLSALKLVTAEKLVESAKNLCLISTVSSSRQGRDKLDSDAVLLLPLTVHGAIFDSGKLAITTSSTSPDHDNKSPIFYITFANKNKKPSNQQQPTASYSLPVYSNLSRQELICHLDVPTSETPDTILLSGAALIVPDY